MRKYLRTRGQSVTTVLLVQMATLALQASISYSTIFGRLANYLPDLKDSDLAVVWLALRVLLIAASIGLWILNRKSDLFQAIILVNGVLTFGLIMSVISLGSALLGVTSQAVKSLLFDVVLIAVTNILIFSVWYWIIDPPGIQDEQRTDAWDFLFPQRGSILPHYESWSPRYTDYLYLAFTASFAFSPTDTLPLTRRAKLLMLVQSSISLVTITGIAGGAINILASGG
jgi:hypothetical protein